MNGVNQQKKIVIMGDFNAHINGWLHEGLTDTGGRQLEVIKRTYGL